MQRLLESRRPGEKDRTTRSLLIVGIVVVATAFFSLVVLPGFSENTIGEATAAPRNSGQSYRPPAKRPKTRAPDVEAPPPHDGSDNGGDAPAAVVQLPPWGYNTDRNVGRWKVIGKAIAADEARHRGRFVLMDYGADQGFFSISAAKMYPNADVMGVEMGGIGGEIWKKTGDVLRTQEGKLKEHGVRNYLICQGKVLPEHFFKLHDAAIAHDYQFILSVFHWFDLPTRDGFERTVAMAFRNAKTTFIELPTIGDNSAQIRRQVGWKNFVKWYDGRTDCGKILRDAAVAQNIKVKVTLLYEGKWMRWTRDVYRVDFLGDVKDGDVVAPSDTYHEQFACSHRRKILGCSTDRTEYQKCPPE
jgi:hypothetical protein